jgi:single-strand DNA-binding protein
MDAHNMVVVRGTITSPPTVRVLRSGDVVTNLEVTSRSAALTASVPVVVERAVDDLAAGDEIVVVGHVRRRFFRSGGTTQSRTEVVATSSVPVRQRRRAARSLEAAMATLAATLLE